MYCLCHLSAHALHHCDGMTFYAFASPEEELEAFRSCRSTKQGRDKINAWAPMQEIALARLLFENPGLRASLYPRPIARKKRAPEPTATEKNARHERFVTVLSALAARATASQRLSLLVSERKHAHHVQGLSPHVLGFEPPAGSFWRAGSATNELLVCSPELHLVLRAAKLPVLDLALLVCSYCGRYDQRPEFKRGLKSREAALTSRERLAAYINKLPEGLPAARRLQTALALAFDNAWSPREAGLAMIASLPREMGGPGLPRPNLNAEVVLSKEGRAILGRETMHPDLLWEEQRVAAEYDSASDHPEDETGERDRDRLNALEESGIAAIPVTPALARTPERTLSLVRRLERELGVPEGPVNMRRFSEAHEAWLTFRFVW